MSAVACIAIIAVDGIQVFGCIVFIVVASIIIVFQYPRVPQSSPTRRDDPRDIAHHRLVVDLNTALVVHQAAALTQMEEMLYGGRLNAVMHDVCEDVVNAAIDNRVITEERLREIIREERGAVTAAPVAPITRAELIVVIRDGIEACWRKNQ